MEVEMKGELQRQRREALVEMEVIEGESEGQGEDTIEETVELEVEMV